MCAGNCLSFVKQVGKQLCMSKIFQKNYRKVLGQPVDFHKSIVQFSK